MQDCTGKLYQFAVNRTSNYRNWSEIVYRFVMTHCTVNKKYLLAVRYPHEVEKNRRNLYRAIRKGMKLTQADIAEKVGISAEAWRYREREKEVYRLGELLALREVVGLSWDEFGDLLEQCA